MEGQQLIDLAKVLGESDARRMVLAIKDLGARSNRTTIENVVKAVFEASNKAHPYVFEDEPQRTAYRINLVAELSRFGFMAPTTASLTAGAASQ